MLVNKSKIAHFVSIISVHTFSPRSDISFSFVLIAQSAPPAYIRKRSNQNKGDERKGPVIISLPKQPTAASLTSPPSQHQHQSNSRLSLATISTKNHQQKIINTESQLIRTGTTTSTRQLLALTPPPRPSPSSRFQSAGVTVCMEQLILAAWPGLHGKKEEPLQQRRCVERECE